MLILHVSDIHFRAPDCLTPALDPERPYRTKLLQDVSARVDVLGPVGAILVSGDISFKGVREEFEVAFTWIQELADAAQCPLERVYVVPGNHDVDRSVILRNAAVRNAQAAIAAADPHMREREFRTQISDVDTSHSLLAPLAAYNEFAKLFNCQVYLPEHLYWKQDLDLEDGVVLRIHGLTSTLLSGAKGRNDTRESLYLSPLQTVLDPVSDVVNLVVCHHPPEWFMDSADANDAICGRAAIHMFGHTHRQRLTRDESHIRFSAGAVNPERNEPGCIPGYNFVEISVCGTGRDRVLSVDAHLRQWQTSPDLFRSMLTQQGDEVFRHTIALPARSNRETLVQVHTSAPREYVAMEPTSSVKPIIASSTVDQDPGAEVAMGKTSTRNLVFRFWNLSMSQRREITLKLGLISREELSTPEPERYGRALIRAGERGILDELATKIAEKETH